jgi:hypothetical protein
MSSQPSTPRCAGLLALQFNYNPRC